MVQENSKYKNSYWYSMDQTSRKSLCYVLNGLVGNPPYCEKPGMCHADELMYLFKLELPLVLCDFKTTISKKDC